jgi:hypothetical protein
VAEIGRITVPGPSWKKFARLPSQEIRHAWWRVGRWIMVQAAPGKKRMNLSLKKKSIKQINKINKLLRKPKLKAKRTGGMTQVEYHLPGKHKALNSNPSTTEKLNK